MHDDPSTATVTARVRFRGVMLMCINSDKHCEVGFIRCPVHEPRIRIQTHTSGGTKTKPPIAITSDIYVKVVNPENKGVILRDVGDNKDFSFVPDIEGPKLHRGKVNVDTGSLRARLAVNAGTLYSHELHPEEYFLVKWNDNDLEGKIQGRFDPIANDPGLNIVCQAQSGSGIAIINADTGNQIDWLPRLSPPSFYTISIDNDCNQGTSRPDPLKTDFRLYYDVISDRDDQRFDFRMVNPASPAPRVCEVAFLSQTHTLGLPFEPETGLSSDEEDKGGE